MNKWENKKYGFNVHWDYGVTLYQSRWIGNNELRRDVVYVNVENDYRSRRVEQKAGQRREERRPIYSMDRRRHNPLHRFTRTPTRSLIRKGSWYGLDIRVCVATEEERLSEKWSLHAFGPRNVLDGPTNCVLPIMKSNRLIQTSASWQETHDEKRKPTSVGSQFQFGYGVR